MIACRKRAREDEDFYRLDLARHRKLTKHCGRAGCACRNPRRWAKGEERFAIQERRANDDQGNAV